MRFELAASTFGIDLRDLKDSKYVVSSNVSPLFPDLKHSSAQEPITESPNFYDDAQVQRILKTINDGLQEFKNIPIDFTKEIVDVNSLLSKLPKLSISRIARIP